MNEARKMIDLILFEFIDAEKQRELTEKAQQLNSISEQLKASKQEVEKLNQQLSSSRDKSDKGDSLYNDLV